MDTVKTIIPTTDEEGSKKRKPQIRIFLFLAVLLIICIIIVGALITFTFYDAIFIERIFEYFEHIMSGNSDQFLINEHELLAELEALEYSLKDETIKFPIDYENLNIYIKTLDAYEENVHQLQQIGKNMLNNETIKKKFETINKIYLNYVEMVMNTLKQVVSCENKFVNYHQTILNKLNELSNLYTNIKLNETSTINNSGATTMTKGTLKKQIEEIISQTTTLNQVGNETNNINKNELIKWCQSYYKNPNPLIILKESEEKYLSDPTHLIEKPVGVAALEIILNFIINQYTTKTKIYSNEEFKKYFTNIPTS